MLKGAVNGRPMCLRCQWRCANRPRTPIATSIPLISTQQLRTKSTRSKKGADLLAEIPESAPIRRYDFRAKKYGLRPSKDGSQHARISRSKGQRVVLKTEDLPVSILGKPAQTLVMRDGGTVKTRTRKTVDEALDAESPADVLQSLEQQGQPATMEEACQNIEELRPTGIHILSEHEFLQIRAILINGFTVAQLSQYIRDFGSPSHPGPGRGLSPDTVGSLTKHPWVESVAPWTPYTPNAHVRLEPVLRGYVTGDLSPKEKLAVHIMRACWGLSLQELMDGLGYVDVVMRDPEFSLLLACQRSSTTTLSHLFMSPTDKIELVRPQRLVRITAPRSAAETKYDAINRGLMQAVTKIFPVRHVSQSPISNAMLEEVGRITHTVTRLVNEDKEIAVTWIQQPLRDPNLEDLKHVVFRLLLTACRPQPATSTVLVHPKSDIARCSLVPELATKHQLSWVNRLGQWARLATPCEREQPKANKRTLSHLEVLKWKQLDTTPRQDLSEERGFLPLPIPPSPQGIVDPAEPPLAPSSGEAATTRPDDPSGTQPEAIESIEPSGGAQEPTQHGWTELSTSTTAILGHVLYDAPSPSSTLQKATLEHLGSRHVMAPVVPPPSSLDLPGDVDQPALPNVVLMRFVPARFPGGGGGGGASPVPPALELRLGASELDVDNVHSLRAVAATHVADVSLPRGRVDLRFVQTRHADLDGRALAARAPALLDFLARSRLELSRGSLETPPRLSLPIPRRLFVVVDDAAAGRRRGRRRRAVPAAEEDEEPVEYLFAGLEVRRPVAGPYRGWRLSYTSVEAGQGGGRRAELCLEALPAPGGTSTSASTAAGADGQPLSAKDFVDAACQLAAGGDMPWLGQYSADRTHE